MQSIRFQKRDVAFLRELGAVVLMSLAMVRQRFFAADRSGRACLRRLRLLKAHGFIARISFPVVSYGNEPGQLLSLYRLTRKGADLLLDCTGEAPQRLLRTEPRPQTLLHRLAVARTMLAVNDAAAAATIPAPVWILEQDMHPGVQAAAARIERFILAEDFTSPEGQVLACRPDASTWLRFPGGGSFHELLVWWEIDRSTESLDQVARKLAGFHRLLRDEEPSPDGSPRRVYRRHWPAVASAPLRVFFVCESEERIQHIGTAIRQLPGAEFVRLTTRAQLTAEHFLADAIWQDVKGVRRAILAALRHVG